MNASAGAFAENHEVARWLRAVIEEFERFGPEHVAANYNNLTSLAPPTQFYAVALKLGGALRVGVLVKHDEHVPHGTVAATEFADLSALAAAAESIDGVLAIPLIPGIDEFGDSARPLALTCIALSQLVHSIPQPRTTTASPVAYFGLSGLGMPGNKDVMWQLEILLPLPPPQVLLDFVRQTSAPPKGAEIVIQPEYKMSLATFCEPLVWFGNPPFPTVSDRILRRKWVPTRAQRCLLTRTIAGVEVHFLNTGMVVAETTDRGRALAIFNQVVAVVARWIAPQRRIRAEELMELRSFNPMTASSDGGGFPVCRRNRLMSFEPLRDGISEGSIAITPSFQADPSALNALVDAVERTIGDRRLATESSRLLTASSLQERSFFTEAFVVAWSVIESVIGNAFEEIWVSFGRGKKRVAEMERDWRAAQQIDLLIAQNKLAPDQGEQLHRLRRIRNELVHGLREAVRTEVEECIATASDMARLPRPDISLDVRTVPL